MQAPYRYGLFLNPQRDDSEEADLETAERKAKDMSIANNGTPVAVWGADDKTVTLFAGYETFQPI